MEGVGSVMPRLMTHCSEGQKEEIDEGGDESRMGIGGLGIMQHFFFMLRNIVKS